MAPPSKRKKQLNVVNPRINIDDEKAPVNAANHQAMDYDEGSENEREALDLDRISLNAEFGSENEEHDEHGRLCAEERLKEYQTRIEEYRDTLIQKNAEINGLKQILSFCTTALETIVLKKSEKTVADARTEIFNLEQELRAKIIESDNTQQGPGRRVNMDKPACSSRKGNVDIRVSLVKKFLNKAIGECGSDKERGNPLQGKQGNPLHIEPLRRHDGSLGDSISKPPLLRLHGERAVPPGLHMSLGYMQKVTKTKGKIIALMQGLSIHRKIVLSDDNVCADMEETNDESGKCSAIENAILDNDDFYNRLRIISMIVMRLSSGKCLPHARPRPASCNRPYCIALDGEWPAVLPNATDWHPFTCMQCGEMCHILCEGAFGHDVFSLLALSPSDPLRSCMRCKNQSWAHIQDHVANYMDYYQRVTDNLKEQLQELKTSAGIAMNQAMTEKQETLSREIDAVKREIGIFSPSHFDSLIGRHLVLLAKAENAKKIWNLVHDPSKRQSGIALFASIGSFLSLMHTRTQSFSDADKLEEIGRELHRRFLELDPQESFTLKNHLIPHASAFIRENGYWGRAHDGTVEGFHQLINSLLLRHRNEPNEGKKLLAVGRSTVLTNGLFDCGFIA